MGASDPIRTSRRLGGRCGSLCPLLWEGTTSATNGPRYVDPVRGLWALHVGPARSSGLVARPSTGVSLSAGFIRRRYARFGRATPACSACMNPPGKPTPGQSGRFGCAAPTCCSNSGRSSARHRTHPAFEVSHGPLQRLVVLVSPLPRLEVGVLGVFWSLLSPDQGLVTPYRPRICCVGNSDCVVRRDWPVFSDRGGARASEKRPCWREKRVLELLWAY